MNIFRTYRESDWTEEGAVVAHVHKIRLSDRGSVTAEPGVSPIGTITLEQWRRLNP